jgi:hypothetical protein
MVHFQYCLHGDFIFFLNFSSLFGIIFGFACGLGYRYRLYDDSHSGGLLWSKGTSLVVAAASVLGLGGYSLFAAFCSSKSDCTEIHPYVVFVPVSIPKAFLIVQDNKFKYQYATRPSLQNS